VECQSVKDRSEEDNRKFMEENHIKTTGTDVPKPVQTF